MEDRHHGIGFSCGLRDDRQGGIESRGAADRDGGQRPEPPGDEGRGQQRKQLAHDNAEQCHGSQLRFLVFCVDSPFVLVLPPFRMPTSKAIFRHTWEKGAQYLRKMGGIIMVASIVIWALGYYPNHDEYESVTEQQENSYIGRIGKAMEPVIEPLGFDWKLGIGILSGVGAKELVVSTLGVLYADDAEADAASLGERIPITPLVAFGYMVFVLIYFPCIATLAAIKGESGSWKWAVFAGLYTTALAWLMSFAIYQIGGLFL